MVNEEKLLDEYKKRDWEKSTGFEMAFVAAGLLALNKLSLDDPIGNAQRDTGSFKHEVGEDDPPTEQTVPGTIPDFNQDPEGYKRWTDEQEKLGKSIDADQTLSKEFTKIIEDKENVVKGKRRLTQKQKIAMVRLIRSKRSIVSSSHYLANKSKEMAQRLEEMRESYERQHASVEISLERAQDKKRRLLEKGYDSGNEGSFVSEPDPLLENRQEIIELLQREIDRSKALLAVPIGGST